MSPDTPTPDTFPDDWDGNDLRPLTDEERAAALARFSASREPNAPPTLEPTSGTGPRWSVDEADGFLRLVYDDGEREHYFHLEEGSPTDAALVRAVRDAAQVPALQAKLARLSDRHTATLLYGAVKARRAERDQRILTIPEIAAVLAAAADLLTEAPDV